MSSFARIAASRSNGRRSRGPRTAAGKSVARRNAVRHGLSAIKLRDLADGERIARLADRICGDDPDPLLRQQALIIAENQVMLARVRAARIAAIEQELGNHAAGSETGCGQRWVEALASETARAAQQIDPAEPRIESEAVRRALPAIERMKRFEGRAWQQVERAIRDFTRVKSNKMNIPGCKL